MIEGSSNWKFLQVIGASVQSKFPLRGTKPYTSVKLRIYIRIDGDSEAPLCLLRCKKIHKPKQAKGATTDPLNK